MRTNTFFLLILLLVFFISGTVFAQQEEITLSTYYPAPFGEYDELCAEKLLVDLPSAAELQDMVRGDCHITRSLIVGSGAGTGFSYDELNAALSLPANGDLLIMGYVGIGTPEPNTALDLDGAFSVRGIPTASAPPVAPVDEGRIYFDSDTDTFKVSVNGGAYDDLVTGAGGAFWEVTASGDHIYNTNTGNVGIGTTDPSGTHKLKVVGPTKIEGKLALLSSAYSVSSLQPGIVFGHCFGIQKANYCSGIHRLGPFPTGSYTVFSSGISDVMTLTDTGNVGIGTTSPTAKLEVAGDAKITGGLKANYDSGWIAEQATTTHRTTLTHNLGVYPTRIEIWFSDDNPPVGPIFRGWSMGTPGLPYGSPESVRVDINTIDLDFANTDELARFWNLGAPIVWESGYMRVLLWK